MTQPLDEQVSVDRLTLLAAIQERCQRAGYSPAAAEITATHLVQAEAEGYRSHGLLLLPVYLHEVAVGTVDGAASVALTHDDGASLVFGGHDAPGHLALATTMDAAVRRAREVHGAVAVWVSQLRHTGRLADYVWPAVEHGVSVVLTVATALDPRSALVAPPGSATRVLGSNPLAIGVSDGATSVVYDGSTAAIPFYELLRRHDAGERLDDTMVVDSTGRPSAEPAAFFDGGAIRPAGGHRGFGLSLTLALLAQLRGAPSRGGAANAFAFLVSGDATVSLRETVDALREAGAYVPGSRHAGAQADPRVQMPASTLEALRQSGVRACDP